MPEPPSMGWTKEDAMLAKRKMAALGLTAGLLGGGAAGMVLGTSPLSGASDAAVVQDEPAADQPDADRVAVHRPLPQAIRQTHAVPLMP